MRLAFNIELREEKQYLLSEEDSKKVMDKAFELAKSRFRCDEEKYFSCFLEDAVQLLLDCGEIEGTLFSQDWEETLTSVWQEEE